MKTRYYIIVLFLSFLYFSPLCFRSQSAVADSLALILKGNLHDTVRFRIMSELAEETALDNPDTSIKICNSALLFFSERFNNYNNNSLNKLLAIRGSVYNTLGICYEETGRPHLAAGEYKRALEIAEKITDLDLKSIALNNLGYNAQQMGHVTDALGYYQQSLKLMESFKDNRGIATLLNNIGRIHEEQQNYQEALTCYERSYSLLDKTENRKELASSLNNIAVIFSKLNNDERAIEYHLKCLALREALGDIKGVAQSYHNLGASAADTDPDKSMEYFVKALEIREKIGFKKGIAQTENNISAFYLRQNKLDKALSHALRSLNVAQEINAPENIRNAAELLVSIYEKKKDFKHALLSFELYTRMNDSISNQRTRKASLQNALRMEFEKLEAADSVKYEEEKKISEAKIDEQKFLIEQGRTRRWSLLAGVLLFTGGLLFAINRFRLSRKQKVIIEQQKKEMETAFEILQEKNKEVIDSIYYARRIQRTLITSESYIRRKLDLLKNKNIRSR